MHFGKVSQGMQTQYRFSSRISLGKLYLGSEQISLPQVSHFGILFPETLNYSHCLTVFAFASHDSPRGMNMLKQIYDKANLMLLE